MSQQYSLKWNNHLPNFIAVFGNLLRTQTLVDVTLSAEGRHLRAHKIVLSACSTYFHTLFVESPNQHPIVILKDVTFADLLKMVDFMYFGEVNVTQEQLPKVLDTAKTLKIKGLTETDTSQATSLTRSQGATADLQSPGGSNESPVASPSPKRVLPQQGSQWSMLENAYPRYNTCVGVGGLQQDAGGGNMYLNNVIATNQDVNLDAYTQGLPVGGPTPGPSSAPDQAPVQMSQNTPTVRRRRTINPQAEENFQRALEAVRFGGIGFCKAARMFGVNNRTLWLEYKKRGYPNNRPSIRNRIKRERASPPLEQKVEGGVMQQPDQQPHMTLIPHHMPVGFIDSRPLDFPMQSVHNSSLNILGMNFNNTHQ
ncbi:uncharacterized protein ACR2FA_009062 [Aphomia sociella]